MLVGAASLPSAPLLITDVGRGLGLSAQQLRASVRRLARSLPVADVLVLVAAGHPALHDTVTADMAGLGYPNVRRNLDPCPAAITALSRLTQYPRVRRPRLPLDLGSLALLIDRSEPVVALEVSATAEYPVLSAVGASVVTALGDAGLKGNIVAAGDLSAGLHDGAPLAAIPGAPEWDARMVELHSRGRPKELGELGPAEAARVGAHGWAPLCVLQGASACAGMTLTVRRYSAPRGAGYLMVSARRPAD